MSVGLPHSILVTVPISSSWGFVYNSDPLEFPITLSPTEIRPDFEYLVKSL